MYITRVSRCVLSTRGEDRASLQIIFYTEISVVAIYIIYGIIWFVGSWRIKKIVDWPPTTMTPKTQMTYMDRVYCVNPKYFAILSRTNCHIFGDVFKEKVSQKFKAKFPISECFVKCIHSLYDDILFCAWMWFN